MAINPTFSGRAYSQDMGELQALIDYMREAGVTRYLEIGARHGDTFYEIMRQLPALEGVAVDLPDGKWGTQKSLAPLKSCIDDLQKQGRAVELILGDSTAKETRDAIKQYRPYDIVLIDGDHSYEGVKKDWLFVKSLKPDYVVFHDIVEGGKPDAKTGDTIGVPAFWQELKTKHKKYDFAEIISEGSAFGIGVVCLV
jgi:predicted O-methyltransferase YrrM